MKRGSSHHNQCTDAAWTRRCSACEPRLSEVVEVYEEAGFEVKLEPLPPKGTDEVACRLCLDGCEDQYRVIYTKPISPIRGNDADLF